MWIDYSWKVEPQNEKKFIAAVEKFTQSELSAFSRKNVVCCTYSKRTEPNNPLFRSRLRKTEDFEATFRDFANSDEFDRFRKALSAAAEPS